jgi:leucyl aminopeptidase
LVFLGQASAGSAQFSGFNDMPIRLPFEQLVVPVRRIGARVSTASLARHSSAILLMSADPSDADWNALPHANLLKSLFKDKVRKSGDSFHLRVGARAETLLIVACVEDQRRAASPRQAAPQFAAPTTFEHLQAAAKLAKIALDEDSRGGHPRGGHPRGGQPRSGLPRTILLWQQGCKPAVADAAMLALVAAVQAAAFRLASFKSKPEAPVALSQIEIARTGQLPELDATLASAAGNNLARWLTALPPNYLDARGYRRLVRDFAQHLGLSFKFYGEPELKRLGAGAFLAVSSGNATRDAGIAYLSYRPRGTAKSRVALVGKGICFDTGGTNLKPHKSMLDMHTDMEGSAVALGSLHALHALRSPLQLDCWLAITENRIGPTAYKPQDVVRAMNGTTIQVIHTDAEGRMVLADTLALAATKKPQAIIDYATLTGACVYALTERYSGAFTNRPATRAAIESAGVASGERVWCFPMDADFDTDLDSSIADVLQCPVEGRGDHILAARFLNRFVPPEIPWLHLDLAAGTRHGGLAHITTDITGFGVRYTVELLRHAWPDAPAQP